MAANIMEVMRQMQRDLADQKEYMRNLHTINRNLNEKLNLMDERTKDLPKVLVTIQRLEQQARKNNMVLFVNDELEIISDATIMPYRSDIDNNDKTEFFGGKSEKSIENTEVTELLNPVKFMEKIKLNGENERKYDYQFGNPELTTHVLEEDTTKEVGETKQPIQFPNCPVCQQNVAENSTTYLDACQTQTLEDKLNKMTDLYQCDMDDLKESIRKIEITIKTFTEEAASSVQTIQNSSTYCSTEQINQINGELKIIINSNLSQTEEVKKLIKDHKDARNITQEQTDNLITICTELKSNAESCQSEMRQMKQLMTSFVRKSELPNKASTASKQKTVQISPTYFSPDQISKLNSELRRVADTYQRTDMVPFIEVIPGAADGHPVMKQLQEGVFYRSRILITKFYKVKLGTNGLERTYVGDIITDYPDLTVNEVVKEWLVTKNQWDTLFINYYFRSPHRFNKATKKYEKIEPEM